MKPSILKILRYILQASVIVRETAPFRTNKLVLKGAVSFNCSYLRFLY